MTTLKQDLEADDVTRQTTALLSVLNYLASETVQYRACTPHSVVRQRAGPAAADFGGQCISSSHPQGDCCTLSAKLCAAAAPHCTAPHCQPRRDLNALSRPLTLHPAADQRHKIDRAHQGVIQTQAANLPQMPLPAKFPAALGAAWAWWRSQRHSQGHPACRGLRHRQSRHLHLPATVH